MTLHITRPDRWGKREVYQEVSSNVCEDGKCIFGSIRAYRRQNEAGKTVMGYYWMDLARNTGRILPKLRNAIEDFEKTLNSRQGLVEIIFHS